MEEIPKTSFPSPSDKRSALEAARADGYEAAVFVTISSDLSATNHTAHLVSSQMPDFPVTIVDTKSVGIAAGLAESRRYGHPAAQRLLTRRLPDPIQPKYGKYA